MSSRWNVARESVDRMYANPGMALYGSRLRVADIQLRQRQTKHEDDPYEINHEEFPVVFDH